MEQSSEGNTVYGGIIIATDMLTQTSVFKQRTGEQKTKDGRIDKAQDQPQCFDSWARDRVENLPSKRLEAPSRVQVDEFSFL